MCDDNIKGVKNYNHFVFAYFPPLYLPGCVLLIIKVFQVYIRTEWHDKNCKGNICWFRAGHESIR